MKFLFVGLGILVITLFMAGSLVFAHEQVHQRINTYFGVESEIEMGVLTGRTVSQIDASRDDIPTIQSLHAMNELVTYQFAMMLGLLGLGQVSSILLLGVCYNGKTTKK